LDKIDYETIKERYYMSSNVFYFVGKTDSIHKKLINCFRDWPNDYAVNIYNDKIANLIMLYLSQRDDNLENNYIIAEPNVSSLSFLQNYCYDIDKQKNNEFMES
jgi:uncharacterized secreted protein with C-terminal beta-propeller domain